MSLHARRGHQLGLRALWCRWAMALAPVTLWTEVQSINGKTQPASISTGNIQQRAILSYSCCCKACSGTESRESPQHPQAFGKRAGSSQGGVSGEGGHALAVPEVPAHVGLHPPGADLGTTQCQAHVPAIHLHGRPGPLDERRPR